MKYLMQQDWEDLVRKAERYEALVAIMFDEERRGTTIEIFEKDERKDVDAMIDSAIERLAEDSRRANGGSECKQCRKEYRKHPRGGPIGYGGEQFLNRLCDGSLVKL